MFFLQIFTYRGGFRQNTAVIELDGWHLTARVFFGVRPLTILRTENVYFNGFKFDVLLVHKHPDASRVWSERIVYFHRIFLLVR